MQYKVLPLTRKGGGSYALLMEQDALLWLRFVGAKARIEGRHRG